MQKKCKRTCKPQAGWGRSTRLSRTSAVILKRKLGRSDDDVGPPPSPSHLRRPRCARFIGCDIVSTACHAGAVLSGARLALLLVVSSACVASEGMESDEDIDARASAAEEVVERRAEEVVSSINARFRVSSPPPREAGGPPEPGVPLLGPALTPLTTRADGWSNEVNFHVAAPARVKIPKRSHDA